MWIMKLVLFSFKYFLLMSETVHIINCWICCLKQVSVFKSEALFFLFCFVNVSNIWLMLFFYRN